MRPALEHQRAHETQIEAPDACLMAPKAWLGAREAWPGAPEASLRASEALLGGRDKQTYVRMDGQMDGRTHKSPYSIGHRPLQGRFPKNSHQKLPNDPKWPYRGRKWFSGAASSLLGDMTRDIRQERFSMYKLLYLKVLKSAQ